MRWFLVIYYVGVITDYDPTPHEFACVRAWNRREAYFEVINAIGAAARDRFGVGVLTVWDAREISGQQVASYFRNNNER
jgi:hypothetical protein